jgi:hypothetical protein
MITPRLHQSHEKVYPCPKQRTQHQCTHKDAFPEFYLVSLQETLRGETCVIHSSLRGTETRLTVRISTTTGMYKDVIRMAVNPVTMKNGSHRVCKLPPRMHEHQELRGITRQGVYFSSMLFSPREDSTSGVPFRVSHEPIYVFGVHLSSPKSCGLTILKIDTMFAEEVFPLLFVVWKGILLGRQRHIMHKYQQDVSCAQCRSVLKHHQHRTV